MMKPMQVLAVAVLALGLAACQKPKRSSPTTPRAADDDRAAATRRSGLGRRRGCRRRRPAADAAAAGAGRPASSKSVVYFDFDSSEIRAEYVQVVAAHAAYLVKFPTARVRLEGHTDERGSREYNIGLGERRAQTVRRALMLQGVAEAQITTVSYGEERPAVEGSDEAAYAQNRRVEIVHAQ